MTVKKICKCYKLTMDNKTSEISTVPVQLSLVRFIVDQSVQCKAFSGDSYLWVEVNIEEKIENFVARLKDLLGIQMNIGLYCQGYRILPQYLTSWFTTLPEPIAILPEGSSGYALERYGTGSGSTIHLPIHFQGSSPPTNDFTTPIQAKNSIEQVMLQSDNDGENDENVAPTTVESELNEVNTDSKMSSLLPPKNVLGQSTAINHVPFASPAKTVDTIENSVQSEVQSEGSMNHLESTVQPVRRRRRNSLTDLAVVPDDANSSTSNGEHAKGTPARRSQRIRKSIISNLANYVYSPVLIKTNKRKASEGNENSPAPKNRKRTKSKYSPDIEPADVTVLMSKANGVEASLTLEHQAVPNDKGKRGRKRSAASKPSVNSSNLGDHLEITLSSSDSNVTEDENRKHTATEINDSENHSSPVIINFTESNLMEGATLGKGEANSFYGSCDTKVSTTSATPGQESANVSEYLSIPEHLLGSSASVISCSLDYHAILSNGMRIDTLNPLDQLEKELDYEESTPESEKLDFTVFNDLIVLQPIRNANEANFDQIYNSSISGASADDGDDDPMLF